MKNSTNDGFDQHYNVQAAVEQSSMLIVATSLSNHPNDKQEAEPTLDALSSKLGPQTDVQGRLLGANGQTSPNLYTIGPLRIAALWESIAIPEIRNQALELAELLITESVESSVLA